MKIKREHFLSRILAILVGLCLLIQPQVSFAAPAAVITVRTPDVVGDTVTVSGTISTGANKQISILVINPDGNDSTKTLKQITNHISQLPATVTSGTEGTFRFVLKMGGSDRSGTYGVKIGGTGVSTAAITSYIYVNKAEEPALLKEMNDAPANGSNNIFDVISKYNYILGLDLSYYNYNLLTEETKTIIRYKLANSYQYDKVQTIVDAFYEEVTVNAVLAATYDNIAQIVNHYNEFLELPLEGDYILLTEAGKRIVMNALVDKTSFAGTAKIKEEFNGKVDSQIRQEVISGDVSKDQKVDVSDAILNIKQKETSSLFDTKQKLAGDVDGDNTITNSDISGILKYIVKLVPNNAATVAELSGSDPKVCLDTLIGNVGQELAIQLKFDKSVNAAGIQLEVNYNNDILSIESVDVDGSLNSFIKEINITVPGKIMIAIADKVETAVTGICKLPFVIKSGAPKGTYPIEIKKPAVFNAQQNPARIPVGITNGAITVKKETLSSDDDDSDDDNIVKKPKTSTVTQPQPSILPTPTATPTPTPVAEPASNGDFVDVDSVSWAQESIKELAKRGIVKGFGDEFKPNLNITREQFIKMLIAAFELEDESAEADFKDIEKGQWYYKYVASAKKLGITNGDLEGNFGIGHEITRQEMAVLAYRATEKANIKLPEEKPKADYADAANIDDYAAAGIQAMQQAGIINGMPDNLFAPEETCTRAMAAKVIYELIKIEQ